MPDNKKQKNYYSLHISKIKKSSASLVRIKLQHDYAIDAETFKQILNSLPFELPKQFSSLKEVSRVKQFYHKLGCTLDQQYHSFKLPTKQPAGLNLDDDLSSTSLHNKQWYKNKTLIIIFSILVILFFAVSLTFNTEKQPAYNDWKGDYKSLKVSAPVRKTLENINTKKPLAELIKSVEKNSLDKKEGIKVSTFYYKKYDGRIDKKLNEKTKDNALAQISDEVRNVSKNERKIERYQKNIAVLKVSLAFNPRNKKAWVKLITTYKIIGEKDLAEKARQEMKKY